MKKILKWALILFVIFIVGILGVNFFVKIYASSLIVNSDSIPIENADCVLVLGAGINNREPSPMLKDRLDVAIDLYKKGIVPKIIMSGDHHRVSYDEVNIMKNYAISLGVDSSDIFMDHAGLSTYDSVYRAKHIFKVNKMIIVTQKYHLYRSLYIAKSLKIEAYGVAATPIKYSGQFMRDLREILARDKDFLKCIFKPESTYMGDTIEVSGNGDITNDKEI